MIQSFLALLLAMLMAAASAVSQGTQSLTGPVAQLEAADSPFVDGDIGFGLQFFTTPEQVRDGIPGFVERESEIEGSFIEGTGPLMGREAMIYFGTDDGLPQAVNAIVYLDVDSQDAAAAFGAMHEELRARWGANDEEQVMAAEGVDESKVTLESVASGTQEAAYQRCWDNGRYFALLTLTPTTEGGLAIVAQLTDYEARGEIDWDSLDIQPEATEEDEQSPDLEIEMPAWDGTYAEGTVGFRETMWRMSEEEVRAAEPTLSMESNGSYLMAAEPIKVFGDYDAQLSYMFVDGLFAADATLVLDGEPLERHLAVYEDIRNQLLALYGEPGSEDVQYDSDRFASEQAATEAGEIMRWCDFSAGDTLIELGLQCDPEGMRLMVDYFDTTQLPSDWA